MADVADEDPTAGSHHPHGLFDGAQKVIRVREVLDYGIEYDGVDGVQRAIAQIRGLVREQFDVTKLGPGRDEVAQGGDRDRREIRSTIGRAVRCQGPNQQADAAADLEDVRGSKRQCGRA